LVVAADDLARTLYPHGADAVSGTLVSGAAILQCAFLPLDGVVDGGDGASSANAQPAGLDTPVIVAVWSSQVGADCFLRWRCPDFWILDGDHHLAVCQQPLLVFWVVGMSFQGFIPQQNFRHKARSKGLEPEPQATGAMTAAHIGYRRLQQ